MPKEVESIYENEIINIKEQNKIDEIKKDFVRWDNIYNSSIDCKDIYNEEYFYYKISDTSLLRGFLDGLISYKERKIAIKLLLQLLKK